MSTETYYQFGHDILPHQRTRLVIGVLDTHILPFLDTSVVPRDL